MNHSDRLLPESNALREKGSQERIVMETLRAHGFPLPIPEFQFHPTRKWRFDFAWPDYRVAIEKEGGIYAGKGRQCQCCLQPLGGAHRSVTGILRDIEKYNEAQRLAWHVLRFPPDRLLLRSSLKLIRDVLVMRGAEIDPNAQISLNKR